jgi:predicted dithiol-disulfide oxidoreductase (DUF899 family)
VTSPRQAIGSPVLLHGEIDSTVNRLEYEVQDIKRRIAELRRARPAEDVKDYSFAHWSGNSVPIADLFGTHDTLMIVHNMGISCSYCTMWADGMNGLFAHLASRTAFILISPDEPAAQKAFAEARGWKFPMYSAHGTSFTEDMGFFHKVDGLMPGVSAFQNNGGKIVRVARAEFGPEDDFCATWHLFDLLPGGAGNWSPKNAY